MLSFKVCVSATLLLASASALAFSSLRQNSPATIPALTSVTTTCRHNHERTIRGGRFGVTRVPRLSALPATQSEASVLGDSTTNERESNAAQIKTIKDLAIHMMRCQQSTQQFHSEHMFKRKAKAGSMENKLIAKTIEMLSEQEPHNHDVLATINDESDDDVADAKPVQDGTNPSSQYMSMLSSGLQFEHDEFLKGNDDDDDEDEANTHATFLSQQSDPLILIDVSAFLHQVYYAMPPLHRKDGTPIGATLCFTNVIHQLMLHRLLQGEKPRVALIFDSLDGVGPGLFINPENSDDDTTYRQKLHPEYKANQKDIPVDLLLQLDLIRGVARVYGIPQLVSPYEYEADDAIATIVEAQQKANSTANILIVSGDKDLMQLVTGDASSTGAAGDCFMIHPITMEIIDEAAVKEKWGVNPSQVPDLLALIGDKPDGIPGVRGIGRKTAAEFIKSFGSLDGIYGNITLINKPSQQNNLSNGKNDAMTSLGLVDLERSLPFDTIGILDSSKPQKHLSSLDELRVPEKHFNVNEVLKFYDGMGFTDMQYRPPTSSKN